MATVLNVSDEQGENTMNKLISTVLATVAFAAVSIILTLPARASAPGLTVRIVNSTAVERSIGACDSGYTVRDESAAGSHHVAFRDGEATLTTRIGSSTVAPMFYCAGERLGFPHAGVEIEMR